MTADLESLSKILGVDGMMLERLEVEMGKRTGHIGIIKKVAERNAGIIGRTLGPMAVTKYGLKKTYLSATIARLVSITALCALLATGHMTLPLMMGFYSINGLLQGVATTAESSIPPALVGQNPAALERFWTWQQTLLETIGVAAPIATGPGVITSLKPMSICIAILVLPRPPRNLARAPS